MAWGAGEGLGRDGNSKDGQHVSSSETVTLPGEVVSQGEEEKMCKPRGCKGLARVRLR